MLIKLHGKHTIKTIITAMCVLTFAAPLTSAIVPTIHATDAYDMSEFQGYLTSNQVRNLKHEVGFVILRVQFGSGYKDSQIEHNIRLMNKYHVPYGVYSYSLYADPTQAQGEARTLYERAPHAKFFVNDMETDSTNGSLNTATQAWANEMHRLTNRPAVLYSGLYFMNSKLTQDTRNKYDAIWLADYGAEPDPSYHYDLWQFSSNAYSRALGESLDADDFPQGNNKPLSFWIGNGSRRGPATHKRSTIKPLNPATKRATMTAQKATHATTKYDKQYYKDEAKHWAKKAGNEVNQLAQIRNAYKQQTAALQLDTKRLQKLQKHLNKDNRIITQLRANKGNKSAMDKQHTATHKKPAKESTHTRSKMTVNPIYYRSKKINHVKVINTYGINCYAIGSGAKLEHIAENKIIHVLGYRYSKHGNYYRTQFIADYDWNNNGSARKCIITSNKKFVRAVNY